MMNKEVEELLDNKFIAKHILKNIFDDNFLERYFNDIITEEDYYWHCKILFKLGKFEELKEFVDAHPEYRESTLYKTYLED